jgi:hypothetical protein
VAVRAWLPWALWFVAFFWLWMFLVADWNRIEWIAGGCVALVAATAVELIRRSTRIRLLVPFDVVRGSALVLPMVFVDFGILLYVLLRSFVTRDVVHGSYVTRSPSRPPTPRGVARRAWTVLLAGYSPNAYVVDIDEETGAVLLHDLVPDRRSEEPA